MNATGPQPARRRSRWPWAVTVLLGIVGVVSAVVRSRRQSSQPERFPLRPDDQLVLRYREEVAAGRSPIGNGVVRAHHRPGADD